MKTGKYDIRMCVVHTTLTMTYIIAEWTLHLYIACFQFRVIFLCRLLEIWRNSISPTLSRVPILGPVMKWFWPAPKREPMEVTQEGLGGAIDNVSRSVTGGLLLPFFAYAVGNICFKSVNNHLRRVILVSSTKFCVYSKFWLPVMP